MKSMKEIFRSHAVIIDGRHTNGTDKESNHHYGDAYERIFTPRYEDNLCEPVYEDGRMATRRCTECSSDTSHWMHCSKYIAPSKLSRDSVRLLLEVGITDGSSMLAWREIFQGAHIVGLDVEPCACERGPRLEFHLGSQQNKADCERAAAGRLFDVVVEDAYHSTENTLLTLFWLWPFVAPGGVYVVEEWADIHSCKVNVRALWPNVEIVDTVGPSGGVEPLVVFRK